MSLNGPGFYDNDEVFASYMDLRLRDDAANDTLEAPVVWDLVGDPAGLAVLDLGCGDARFGRELLERGAARYLGVEGSRNMAAAASSALAGTAGAVECAALEGWPFPGAEFDLVVSRLALHYVDDLAAVLAGAFRALRPGGRLVFSVEHPVMTSCDRSAALPERRGDWIVDDYFTTGERVIEWLGASVRIYHRTLEQYFASLQRAGFAVEQLRESEPRPEFFPDPAILERRKRLPLFLMLAARKPIAASR